jgi:cytochrome P450
MFLLYAGLSLALPYLIWSVFRFANNYIEAKKIGLPIVISPIDPRNPLWLLTKDRLKPIISRLPFGLGEWADRAEVGWTFYPRFSVHAKYGQAFTIVSPGTNEVYMAEPTATEDILRRRNDFIKDPDVYGMLDFYGPNLDTVNGKAWDRHRKITVPPFNEQNSALVWRETAEQADQMLEVWSKAQYVTTTQSDVHAVALNVLCGAGFGLHSSFVDTRSPVADGQSELRLGYRQSLQTLLANIIQLVLLSLLKKAGIPQYMFFGGMRRVALAYEEFKGYMMEMLEKEKAAFEQGDLTRHNLMSALVRASEQSREGAGTSKESSDVSAAGLSDEEVLGNLFIYNLAGHDTTAATLHFAITLLAVFPEWQTWIAEEVDEVRKADPSGLWYYEETFPLLERCLALMVRMSHTFKNPLMPYSTRLSDCTDPSS